MKVVAAIREALAEQPAPVAAVNTSSERVDKTEENVHEKPARYATTIGEGNLSANGFEGDWFKKPAQQDQGQSCYCPECERLSKELAALKAQQQEPVAWMKDCADFWEHYTYISEASQENYKAEAQMWVEKLRTSPQPSKPWVGLSTVELDEIDAPIRERGHATIAEIYRAIEAKLREKNNG